MTDGYCRTSALQGNIKLWFPFIPNNSSNIYRETASIFKFRQMNNANLCYIMESKIKQGSYRMIEGSIKKEDGVVCRNFTVGSGTEGLCVIFRPLICLNRPENALPVFGRVSYEISHMLSATLKIVYDYNVYKSSFNQIRLSAVHINSFIYILTVSWLSRTNPWLVWSSTVGKGKVKKVKT
jgi:hypothetical protein